MKSITKISLDFQRENYGATIQVMQNDSNSRVLIAELTDNGNPWVAPIGASAQVLFLRPDGAKGVYDKLANGQPATAIKGSTVEITMSREMIAVPGIVSASICFTDSELDQLTVFPFEIDVEESPFDGAEPTQDVVRLQWLEDELGKWLKKAAESGEFDGPPGKTPVSGVDYFTPAEVQQFEDAVYDRAVQKIDPVLESAGAATQAAGTAAKNADVKAKAAETAAQGADTAAAGANQAAAEASKQSSVAGEAANGANHAAGLANAAAEGAKQAAQRADTAAQSAGQAAQEATSAAVAAGTAASDANTAAQAVSGAAEKAETAANAANDAAAAIPEKIAGKLDKPAAHPVVGQILKVQKINPDGTFAVAWADDGGGTVSDVQIDGKTIVQDGVANVQLSNGLTHNTALGIATPTQEQISGRNPAMAITGATLDSGVKAAMCDGKGPAWTAAEQVAARDRMRSCIANSTTVEIANITTSEEVASVEIPVKAMEFKRIFVEVIAPKIETAEQQLILSCTTNSGSKRDLIRVPVGAIGNAIRYTHVDWVVSPPVSGSVNMQVVTAGTYNLPNTQMRIAKVYQPEVTKVMLSSAVGAGTIPAGTKIAIFAVE